MGSSKRSVAPCQCWAETHADVSGPTEFCNAYKHMLIGQHVCGHGVRLCRCFSYKALLAVIDKQRLVLHVAGYNCNYIKCAFLCSC